MGNVGNAVVQRTTATYRDSYLGISKPQFARREDADDKFRPF